MARRGDNRAIRALRLLVLLLGIALIGTPAQAGFGVIPIAECRIDNPFTDERLVVWGYNNTNQVEVTVESAFNFFVPGPSNRDQIETFAPGANPRAFTTISPIGAGAVTWVLGEFFSTADDNIPTCFDAGAFRGMPTASDLSLGTNRDVPLPITLSGIDTFGAPITFSISSQPAHGTLSGSGATYTYTPALGFTGSDSFQYQAANGASSSASATVTITVAPMNRAPAAMPDSFSTAEESALSVAAPGVLGNDSDPDGNPITVTGVVAGPAHGAVTINANGSFSYTPAPLFAGTDSFAYSVSDGLLTSAPATVSIVVTPVNHAPVATSASLSTPFQTPVAVHLVANDVDGQALAFSTTSLPTHGSLSGSAPNLTYTPAANYQGPDTFTFKVNDGTVDSNVATVNLTVTAPPNRPPAAAPDSYATPENTSLTVAAPGVLGNDTDPDAGTVLTAVVASGPSHGTLSSLSPTGGFTYKPAPNFSGTDSFTYRASDGVLTSAATVTVLVTHVNQPPIATGATLTTSENTALPISLVVVDVDADPLAYSIVTNPAHGALNGGAPKLNYTPAAYYHGSDSFTFKANDGSVDSNTATISITVAQVNQPPVALPDSYSVAEETTLSVAAPGVLTNDSDPDSSTITAALASAPAHGTVTLNADGSFVYAPAAGFKGTDGFTYTSRDGLTSSSPATVTIQVSPVNHAPTVTDASVSTPEQPIPITLIANDADGDSLSIAITHAPLHGAISGDGVNLLYTPTAFYSGSDSFDWVASDGRLQSPTGHVAITVTPVNHAPLATDDSYSRGSAQLLSVAAPGVLGNDNDPDGDHLAASLIVPPQIGTVDLHADGSFTFSAVAGSPASFMYAACDPSNACNRATVRLTMPQPATTKATGVIAGSTTICSGGSATLEVALGGTPPWTVVWNDGVSATSQVSQLERTVSPSFTTTYAIQSVSDASGPGVATGSAEVRVDKVPDPPAIDGSPAFRAGGSRHLSATAGYDSYRWYRNGIPLPGANGQDLVVFGATSDDAGAYTVTGFQGGCPSAPSAPLTITIEQPLRLILPVVGSTVGAFGSSFRTQVQITNASSATIHGTLVFHRAGVAGSPQDPSLPVVIAANKTLAIDDLGRALGVEGVGSADLFIEEGVAPDVLVNVLNDGGIAGTTGLSCAPIGTDDLLRTGATARLIAPPDPVRNRFNLGVRTVDDTVIRITLRSGDSRIVASKELQFPADWFMQTSAADLLGAALTGSDTITVEVLHGALVVYATSTDNRSNDPTIQFAH